MGLFTEGVQGQNMPNTVLMGRYRYVPEPLSERKPAKVFGAVALQLMENEYGLYGVMTQDGIFVLFE